MRPTNRIKQAGAIGYILLWLLGIPIPILLLIFLLRGLHITLGRKLTGNKIYVVDYICDSRCSLASRFSPVTWAVLLIHLLLVIAVVVLIVNLIQAEKAALNARRAGTSAAALRRKSEIDVALGNGLSAKRGSRARSVTTSG